MSIPATSSTISSAPILTNVGGGGAAGGGQGGGCMPQQKDTTLTKIFVGGLPYHTTDESLRMYFAVYGDIEEAVVITDRQTGKSRGYGFVSDTFIVFSCLFNFKFRLQWQTRTTPPELARIQIQL